ncbi:MAG: single-stranded-DNA-specific exonuclease RecJ [Candidatus Omnitrophica bacterium]|nr:single-stranded-DNA-specific exonuclease RecJ [Candidatus Omnitrophota bacterium]
MDSVWNVKQVSEISTTLYSDFNLSEVIVHILQERNITDPEDIQRFLYGKLDDEHDPFLLKGMDVAVIRIKEAIDRGEKILVHGDYDVDGVTATAILGKTLEELGADYYLYLPERLKGGYGVSKKAVYYAREQTAKLIITVDCGISAYEEVMLANSFGIDVVVTDHHCPAGEELPQAYVIVNAWQKDCPYPFKELSGVGIAYKLARALLGGAVQEKFLDLVALGTVCDLSPLVDENRILVKYGLEKLDKGGNCGLVALKKMAKVRKKSNTGHLGFIYGPRINASGRLGSAEWALRLLITNSRREAESLSAALNEENKERQKLEQFILQEAIRKVEQEINFNKEKIIVIWNSSWHLGVIGIVAQRLVERYNRPTIVISLDREAGFGRGSARSIKGLNIFQALTHASKFLTEFGGHEYAAGIEIAIGNLQLFREHINQYAQEIVGDTSFVKQFAVDAEITFSEINKKLLMELELLEPYGRGNPKPLFLTRGLICKERSIFLSKNTIKLWVTDGVYTYEAIWYKASVDTKIITGDRFDIIYNLVQRRWQDRDIITLEIKDLRMV